MCVVVGIYDDGDDDDDDDDEPRRYIYHGCGGGGDHGNRGMRRTTARSVTQPIIIILFNNRRYIYIHMDIIGTADERYDRRPFIGCHRVEAVRQIEISTGNSRHALRTIWPDD